MNRPPPTRGFCVQGLGEVAIRCANLQPMVNFYRDIIGLPILSGNQNNDIVFLRIGDGVDGHTCVLALFQDQPGFQRSRQGSSLHHVALSLSWNQQERAIQWYRQHQLDFEIRNFDWIGWRGVFTLDPEGNQVELVAARPDHSGQPQTMESSDH